MYYKLITHAGNLIFATEKEAKNCRAQLHLWCDFGTMFIEEIDELPEGFILGKTDGG